MKKAYNIQELAKATGIGKTTLFKLLKENKLQRIKCGSRTLVTAASVDSYFAQLTASVEQH